MTTKPLYILSSVAVSLLVFQTIAGAQDHGFYFKVGAGPAWNQKTELKEFLGLTDLGNVKFDIGVRFDAGVGYQFNKWISTEFETGFIYNGISGVERNNISTDFGDSSLSSVPLMVNLVLTAPISNRLVPFVGGGVGGVASILDVHHLNFAQNNNTFINVHGTDSDVVFAWQGFAGLRYIFSERFDLSLAYRYLGAQAPSWDVDFFGGPLERIKLGNIHNQSVVLSANLRF